MSIVCRCRCTRYTAARAVSMSTSTYPTREQIGVAFLAPAFRCFLLNARSTLVKLLGDKKNVVLLPSTLARQSRAPFVLHFTQGEPLAMYSLAEIIYI